MAVSLENSNKVWQKVKSALNVAGVSRSGGAFVEPMLALKHYLATQKGNPDLQFIPFSAADIITAPAVLLSGAARVYAIYVKRVGDSDSTDSFVSVYDDATDDAGFAIDTIAQVRFSETQNQEGALILFPGGNPVATGLVVASNTDADGTTGSASTESADGFLVVGAA